ncbi:class II fructose-bisphosphate aldolase [Candidatus Bathyarchaeota archaeon]|nr:class II fructose-bisphosphate aldolase [Candidatus Bathyarchaeota archaeon]MBL7169201.1 class II fructose-bisphosphate aldolase [Candidatus Bathyarchaeota archaeon]
MNEPIPGNVIFESLRDKGAIVLASNARTTAGVVEGIFKAAKTLDSAVIIEIARSECNLDGGYTGMTPKVYAEEVRRAAESVDFDVWSLHADHVTVKKGTPEDVSETRKLLDAQIAAGFTSFAIDASHLFNLQGGNLREELAQNIDVTTELTKHIESRISGRPFGLEVEVGEIGKKDEHGHVVTTPEEAVTFVKALNENSVYPQVLAIANGSTHGNVYDEHGNMVEQVSIDIPRTRAVAKALRENGLDVRIAQHGITGTPRELISELFPKGDIIKGNVATFWQNLVLDTYKIYQPELYRDIHEWTLETYRPKNPGKADNEVFGKNVKYAIKQYKERIDEVDEETIATIEALSYGEARTFIKAFGSKGTASTVRRAL